MARGLFKVIACPSCRWLQITTAEKTTRCKRCGKRIDMASVEPLAIARTAQEAREKMLAIKARALGKRGHGSWSSAGPSSARS